MSEEFFNYEKKVRRGDSREGYSPRRENTFSNRQSYDRSNRSRFNNDARGERNDYRRNNYQDAERYGNRPSRFSANNENGANVNRWGKRPNSYRDNGEEFASNERPYRQQNSYNSFSNNNHRRTSQYGEPNKGRNGFQRTGGYSQHAKYSHKKQMEYKETHIDPNEPVRLNKFLANAGVCSRRDADKYIEAGVVTVNGQIVTELGTKVMRTDVVLFHDNAIKMEKKVYVLLNKPKGYVTTNEDPQNRKTVMDLVKDACQERIYPVGRLDRNTTGVLLLTNDGEMASKLTHPKFLKKKIYHVYTDQNVTAADLRQIAEGVTLEDGEIRADAIDYASDTDKKQVGIEIHSGKNRIVRRIFEHLGYHVIKLDRVYFAGLTKKNLRRGDWRYLTEKEVNMLRMGAYE